jgi:hypothetical protein
MKQILHIFAKDIRRFWPETLLSLVILAALVHVYPQQWAVTYSRWEVNTNLDLLRKFQMLSSLLCVLVPVGWFLLIGRLIHAEALVGDRQYWLTRPYDWKKLLIAKLLFLLVFLYLPLIAAQAMMLIYSGLNPLSSITGMLFNLLLITGIVVLPLIAIAAVTSSFFRMTITLLAIVIGAAAYAFSASGKDYSYHTTLQDFLLTISQDLSPAHILRSSSQLSFALLLICFCGAAIVLQYALRRAWISRSILLVIPALLACIILLMPNAARSNQAQFDRDYPRLSAGESAPIQFSADPGTHLFASRWPINKNMTNVFLSLHVTDGTAVMVDREPITVEAPDGFHWSGIVSFGPGNFSPGLTRSSLGFDLPTAVYTRLQANPVTLRITLPMTLLQATKATRVSIPAPGQEVVVPDYGVCGFEPERSAAAPLRCRSAFRQPRITSATAQAGQVPCSAPYNELRFWGGQAPWSGLSDSEPAEFSIGPVASWEVGIAAPLPIGSKNGSEWHLCTGDTVTFTQYEPVRRLQTTVTIANFQLPVPR